MTADQRFTTCPPYWPRATILPKPLALFAQDIGFGDDHVTLLGNYSTAYGRCVRGDTGAMFRGNVATGFDRFANPIATPAGRLKQLKQTEPLGEIELKHPRSTKPPGRAEGQKDVYLR